MTTPTTTVVVAANLLQIAGWWSAVLLAAGGHPWIGSAVLAAILAAFFRLAPWTWRVALATSVAGTAADLALAIAGVVLHRAPLDGWLVAPWMSGLWLLVGPWLAIGAPEPLRRPLIGIPVIAIASGVAYAGGARLGAIAVHPDPVLGGLIVALATLPAGWAAVRFCRQPEVPHA